MSEAVRCDQCEKHSTIVAAIGWWHVTYVNSGGLISQYAGEKDFCSDECAYDFFAKQMKQKREHPVKGTG